MVTGLIVILLRYAGTGSAGKTQFNLILSCLFVPLHGGLAAIRRPPVVQLVGLTIVVLLASFAGL